MSDYIVGVDEVGRGSLVGSAVVCAFRSDDEFFQTLPFDIVDSKKISHKKRQLIYDFFTSNKSLNFSYKIVVAKQKEIEQKNIHLAILDSMAKAVIGISKITDHIIIDGKFLPPELEKYHAKTLVKADLKIKQVSAASIIAKVYRDKILEKLHSIESFYEWNKNAGYGTKNHLRAITNIGISKFHRKTYQPISKLITKLST
jgi:ribonuclease HII